MEKYEYNKFYTEYEKRLKDLFEAFSIETQEKLYKELEEKTKDINFWSDQKTAQKVIADMNAAKEKLDAYNKAKNDLNDINEMSEMAFEDEEAMELLEESINDFKDYVSKVEVKALLSGKYDNNACILELHPGAGGTESMDWADMLFRMYKRYAERKGFKFEVLDYLPGDEAGIKSVSVEIKGPFAYGMLKCERGIHRLVRISPFNAQGKRQTSFVSCDVAPVIEDSGDIVIKEEDLRIDTFCSSGPGGQGVNTTYSAVRITHIPSGVVVSSQQERSQLKNKDICMRMLKSKLAELEIQRQEEELRKIKGIQMGINFGSQIRSYVFCPYTMVKDHRTEAEVGNIASVMDGDLDIFIDSYLKFIAGSQE